MLEASAPLSGLVAPPNRIKWLGLYHYMDPVKEEHTDSDYPEVRIDPGEPFAEPDVTTGTSGLVTNWMVLASSNKLRLDSSGYSQLGGGIFAVIWALYRTLVGWQQNILNLQYNSIPFVYKVSTGVPVVRIEREKPSGKILAWTSGWNYKVHTMFETPAILAPLV
jgi:hypothetical protein